MTEKETYRGMPGAKTWAGSIFHRPVVASRSMPILESLVERHGEKISAGLVSRLREL